MSTDPIAAPLVLDGERRLIIAGFGGQGILTLGKLLCTAALREGQQTTYLPSYGAEVRGGTANCQVVISPTTIYSPLVEQADAVIAFNQPSYDRFAPRLREGGLLVSNVSAVVPHELTSGRSVQTLDVPASEMAAEIGSVQVANIVILGAFLTACPVVGTETGLATVRDLLGKRKADLLELNVKAFSAGVQLAMDAVHA
jgi:2-oxoglutarate ferredoxin oxidoreductase subunit gamma